MNFEQFMEEWKPFPKDKVNRQIDKKRKSAAKKDPNKGEDPTSELRTAHEMQAVKNYRTKMTDVHKARQKLSGSDLQKTRDKQEKHFDTAKKELSKYNKKYDKADDKAKEVASKVSKKIDSGKMSQKKGQKKYDKAISKRNKTHDDYFQKHLPSKLRGRGMSAVDFTDRRNNYEDDEKQAAHNRKDKESRSKAKRMMDVTKLEKAAAAKPKRERVKMKAQDRKGIIKKPKMRSESAFTDFVNDIQSPLYEKEGELPKCPPGYKFDKEVMMCVPKTPKDAVGNSQKYGDKDLRPGNGAGYNTWGSSGYDGAGYAWEEKPTGNDLANNGG